MVYRTDSYGCRCFGLPFIEHNFKTNYSDSFQGSAAYCNVEDYIKSLPGSEGNDAINSLYDTASKRTMSDLNSNEIKDEFLKSADVIAAFKIAFPKKKDTNKADYSYELKRYFDFKNVGVYFYVTVRGTFENDAQRANAKLLADSYIKLAVKSVVPNNDTAAIKLVTITEAVPDYTGEAAILQRGYGIDFLIGLGVGVVVGFIAVIIVYFADLRVKSYESVSGFTGELIAKDKDESIDKKKARYLSAKMMNDKSLFVCSFNNAPYGSGAAKAVAVELANCGLKTLLIDFSDKSNAKENIGAFLAGADVLPKETDGVARFGAGSESDWFLLINKKERFESLAEKYEKVVIFCPENNDGSAAVIEKYADKITYIIDQKNIRLKHVKKVVCAINRPEASIGTVIHNPI